MFLIEAIILPTLMNNIMSLSKRTSKVWEFFEVVEEDETKAKCKICKTCVSRGGTGKKATTSALNNHLKTKHHDHWKESSGNDEIDIDADSPSCSRGVKRKQQTLEACVEKRKLGI